MVQLHASLPPPPDYYRDNFIELVTFVSGHYRAALRPVDVAYVDAFLRVELAAQRLLVRLFMRQGPLFRVDALHYAEVEQPLQAIAALQAEGLINMSPPAAAETVMSLLTRSELAQVFPAILPQIGRAARRAELVLAVLSRYSDPQIRDRLASVVTWLELVDVEVVRRLQLLCFGALGQDLSAFVLRDLGMQRIESYRLDVDGGVGFNDVGVIDRYLDVAAVADQLPALDSLPTLAESLRARLTTPSVHRPTERRRSRMLNDIGRWHERRGEFDRAVTCYEASTRHPARERLVRICEKHPHLGSAESLLVEMQTHPWGPEELVFAQRRTRSTSIREPLVRTRPLLAQDLVMRPGAIEHWALTELAAAGGWGLHLENRLPLGLTALAYWDVLYLPVSGAFTHLFQTRPHDLYQDDFASPRQAAIDARHAELLAAKDPGRVLLDTFAIKNGIANAMVSWKVLTRAVLERVLEVLPAQALVALTRTVIDNPGRCRTGFPDLFVHHADGTSEFVEVKGPSDQLQPQQRAWLDRLATLGIPASVLKYTTCQR